MHTPLQSIGRQYWWPIPGVLDHQRLGGALQKLGSQLFENWSNESNDLPFVAAASDFQNRRLANSQIRTQGHIKIAIGVDHDQIRTQS
jgi:hypothetical protein